MVLGASCTGPEGEGDCEGEGEGLEGEGLEGEGLEGEGPLE
jgi:hypothetical protein